MITESAKINTVINKNTFYFYNEPFEVRYEGYITSLKETLLSLKNKIEEEGCKKLLFESLLSEKENGLRVLLALTGFSNEMLKRLISLIRIVDDKELNQLVYKDQWSIESEPHFKEWSDKQIDNLLKTDSAFTKGIVNLFFEGSTVPFLARTIPLFELKKLSISKLSFDMPEMIDTLVRYKEKGSYTGIKENNPEVLIATMLDSLGITFETGDLNELVKNAFATKRTMDFIIPSKAAPRLIVECSFLVTTSSGQGDKSKTEISVNALIRKHFPKARFIGFVDGIGWYVRTGDLARMVSAYDDVFTFHTEELKRFETLLGKLV